MTLDKENAPAGQAEADTTTTKCVPNSTQCVVSHLETEYLRALLALPAARFLEAVGSLHCHDIYDDHHRTILAAATRRARVQVAADEGTAGVPVVAVQLDLQETGQLSHGNVAWLLNDVATGNPAPPHVIADLATGLRLACLRRACATVGLSLADAGTGGSNDDIKAALMHLPHLREVAERAGMETPR